MNRKWRRENDEEDGGGVESPPQFKNSFSPCPHIKDKHTVPSIHTHGIGLTEKSYDSYRIGRSSTPKNPYLGSWGTTLNGSNILRNCFDWHFVKICVNFVLTECNSIRARCPLLQEQTHTELRIATHSAVSKRKWKTNAHCLFVCWRCAIRIPTVFYIFEYRAFNRKQITARKHTHTWTFPAVVCIFQSERFEWRLQRREKHIKTSKADANKCIAARCSEVRRQKCLKMFFKRATVPNVQMCNSTHLPSSEL